MKKRKAVAVCVTKYDWEYESRIIEGIRRQCAADDIDLLVFSNLMEKVELGVDRVIPENIVRGEVEIYNLINYEMLDGIIILGDNMLQNDIIEKVSKKAALHGLDSAPALAIVAAHPPNHIGSRVVFCAREAEAVDSGSNHSTVRERGNCTVAIAIPVFTSGTAIF